MIIWIVSIVFLIGAGIFSILTMIYIRKRIYELTYTRNDLNKEIDIDIENINKQLSNIKGK